MMTRQQAFSVAVNDAAQMFLTRLEQRVKEGYKTQDDAKNMCDRLERGRVIALTPGAMVAVQPDVYEARSTGKDKSKVYTVSKDADAGQTCNCPDAAPDGGKAHCGWCKHRASVYLARSAEAALTALQGRLEGLTIPHMHTYACGHMDHKQQPCWDGGCTALTLEDGCPDCEAARGEEPPHLHDPDDPGSCPACAAEEPQIVFLDEVEPAPQAVVDAVSPPEFPPLQTEQYEPAPVVTPKPAPLPEAPASLNLKVKHHNIEVMMTLRAHTDAEILERLPKVLEGLSAILGVTFTN